MEKDNILKKGKLYFERGVNEFTRENYKEAEKFFNLSLELVPQRISTLNNLAGTLIKLEKYNESESLIIKILEINADDEIALLNYGIINEKKKIWDKCIEIYKKLVKLNGNKKAIAYMSMGNVYYEMGRVKDALDSYKISIETDAGNSEAYNNIGTVYYSLKKTTKAIDYYIEAIKINKNYTEAYTNIGIAYNDIGKVQEAIRYFNKSLQIDPLHAEAYFNLGVSYKNTNQIELAITNFEKSYLINEDQEQLLGIIAHAKMSICDWDKCNKNTDLIISGLMQNKMVCNSFVLLSMIDDTKIHKKAVELQFKNLQLGDAKKINSIKDKITIGYYSSDFNEHPVSYLTAELFEKHNRNKFEIIAFYTGRKTSDEMHKRIKNSFNEFIECNELSDDEIVEMSRELEIDIAVDLTGNTQNGRVSVFAKKVAPIQITYIGYLGTLGNSIYNFIIADEILIPVDKQKYYSENIIYLPSYQVNDSKKIISDRKRNRNELGIGSDKFVFCCMNNSYKITPDVFKIWMRILKKVENSVLVIYADLKITEINLIKECKKHGINVNRIIFKKRMARDEYLADYQLYDLFLDTFPYNAGATASDSLWMGVPILTVMGESFASRYAASLLNAINLSELITHSFEEYETKAVELALNRDKHKKIINKLSVNKNDSKLFNIQEFTRTLECAYETIMQDKINNEISKNYIIN
jgi:protein O-GlcNAc transferase